ncbi:MAG: TIGR00341 family protein [Rikenellaceae bacterium]|nr:TIGR00341 family protein [Rikenellaceae bacterium]
MDDKNYGKISGFLKARFDLHKDKAEQDEVVDNVRKGVEFSGTNLWVLIFAIIIASVGLNVNSAAVIIGAMLISPLMGPIMGIGLSLGINDFELLKVSFRNFVFSVVVSLVVSTVYFILSPLSTAQSEILARTSPTVWDVLVATAGGLAGIVAQSRKDRTSTVIPGVAIATALMPPLCTAGYGLASLNIYYFFGALYLFLINAVFISLSTFVIIRAMKYKKVEGVDARNEWRIRRIMVLTVVAMIVPSVFLGYKIARSSIFEAEMKNFVESSFNFDRSMVVRYDARYDSDTSRLEVVMMGEPLTDQTIASLQGLLDAREPGTRLTIRQQDNGDRVDNSSIDKLYAMSATMLSDKDKRISELEKMLDGLEQRRLPINSLKNIVSTLDSTKTEIALAKVPLSTESGESADSIVICYISSENGEELKLSREQTSFVREWLRKATSTERVEIIIR